MQTVSQVIQKHMKRITGITVCLWNMIFSNILWENESNQWAKITSYKVWHVSYTHRPNQWVLWGHRQKCVLSTCPCLALDVKYCNDLYTLWLVVSRWDRRLWGVDSLNHLIMSIRASYTGNRKWLRQGEDGEPSYKSPWENLFLSLGYRSVAAISHPRTLVEL